MSSKTTRLCHKPMTPGCWDWFNVGPHDAKGPVVGWRAHRDGFYILGDDQVPSGMVSVPTALAAYQEILARFGMQPTEETAWIYEMMVRAKGGSDV